MRNIPYVIVYQRKPGTDNDHEEIASYPFPDLTVHDHYYKCSYYSTIPWLRAELQSIKHQKTKEAQLTRLSFILDRWHVGKFVKVEFKPWKYEE
jgi:hypothetical protein